jgi:DNA-binding transcriptional regulator YiaG
VQTAIMLGWWSGDAGARAVVGRWASLSRTAKRKVELEEICRAVGVDAGQFVSAIVKTAIDLEIDVSGLISVLDQATFVDPATIAKSAVQRQQFWRFVAFSNGVAPVLEEISLARVMGRRGPSARIGRGQSVRSAEARRSCREMATARGKWKLSSRQFATLFFTSAPTIRRWENRQFTPTPHQQWLLGLLVRYAERNGMAAFRQRFVGQAPRYRKPGRPRRKLFAAPVIRQLTAPVSAGDALSGFGTRWLR